ncbi:hypothetical protein [Variovorax boronicumulans]|uniref:hypothetical protein n=1 Tax=Variovorax boronicumulans TaxID=436515 RepID=UPI0012FD94B5|nr:hypothetical protein [Variovorax boronicumulans]
MKRRPDPATGETPTPFEQMVREIARYGLGLFVVATLALCMLALALAEVPGSRP